MALYFAGGDPHAEDRCVCCGAEIPEGRQVCPNCERGSDGFPDTCGGCENLKIAQTSIFDASFECERRGFYCDTDGNGVGE